MTIRLVTDRGGLVESEHLAVGVVVDGLRQVQWTSGPQDADHPVFLRSAAKPFQASGAVAAGVADRLGLTDRHLAAACSSHDASPEHLDLVDDILAAARLGRDALQCGTDGQGGAFEHQCSGNHALGLAWCVVAGWPTDSYLDVSHPLQTNYERIVAEVTGVTPEVGPDGCGMRTFRVPLSAYALAFCRLGAGAASVPGLDRVAAAMRANPRIVRWAGEPDCELMRASDAFVAKVGADGSIGVGHSSGLGAALKVLDGAPRAVGPAMAEMLGAVDRLRSDLAPLDPAVAEPPVLDGQGRTVGRIRVGRISVGR